MQQTSHSFIEDGGEMHLNLADVPLQNNNNNNNNNKKKQDCCEGAMWRLIQEVLIFAVLVHPQVAAEEERCLLDAEI